MSINLRSDDLGWTPERLAKLPELYQEGLSLAQIASALGGGLTRGSVSGKIYRAKLMRPASKSNVGFAKDKAPNKHRERLLLNPEVLAESKEAQTPMGQCTIFDLGSGTCRWPLWGNSCPIEEQFYCGNEPANGSSYCKGHSRVAFKPVYRSQSMTPFYFSRR